MKLLLLFFLLTFYFTNFTLLHAQNKSDETLSFYNLTNSDGLSYSFVTSIAQDKEKRMWFGTIKGLNLYDGSSIKRFYHDEKSSSIPHNNITVLHYADNQQLFIGTENGLCYYRDSLEDFKSIFYNGSPLPFVKSITAFTENQLLINTIEGVFLLTTEAPIFSLKKLSNSKDFLGIQVGMYHHLWGFTAKKVMYMTPEMQVLDSLFIQEKISTSPIVLTSQFIDSKGDVWIGTKNHGLYKFERQTHQFQCIYKGNQQLGNELKYIRSLGEDHLQRLWIGTENGLFIYSKEDNTFTHFTQDFDDSKKSINDNAIYSIFKGKEEMMWLGTYFGGVNNTSLHRKDFQNIIPDGGKVSLKGKAVSQVIEDTKNNLWFGTEDKGISIYSQKDKKFSYLTKKEGLSGNNVHALLEDVHGNIWVGTYLDGLNKIDNETKSIQIFKKELEENSISNNSVYALFQATSSKIYIGTLDGVDVYDEKTNTFLPFKYDIFKGKHIDDIIEDKQGNIWFSSYRSGVFQYIKNKDSVSVHHSSNAPFTSDSFISSYIDTKNRLWFGTRSGGLVQYESHKKNFKIYNSKALKDNDVYGILEDDKGYLWLSTNRGIAKFNPLSGEVIMNYTTDHGLLANQYNFKSYYKGKEGKLFFGSVKGLTFFDPSQLFKKSFKTIPIFTDFILNEEINTNNKPEIPKNINYSKRIELPFNYNSFSIYFNLPTYHSIINSIYQYKLEGFDQEWKNTTSLSSKVNYTNLDPGKYTFHVRYSYDGRKVNFEEKKIEIEILKHPLTSPLAYSFYALFFTLMFYGIGKKLEEDRKEKTRSKIAIIEEKKKQELDEHKMNFFTNISHEFKTPLTIILAVIEEIFMVENKLSLQLKKPFQTINRNAVRLKFLIAQLMEFRQIESDHAPINLSQFDFIEKLNSIYTSFQILFDKKQLRYHFEVNEKHLMIVNDEEKIEKIISNVLSNAYKYTNLRGEIRIELNIKEDAIIEVKISNSGHLLSGDDIQKIFDPFFKKENSIDNSGIGMAIVKSLTSLLAGKIEVLSNKDIGNQFILSFPLNQFDLSEVNTQKKTLNNTFTKDLIDIYTEDEIIEEENEISRSITTNILIVEDNNDLGHSLKRHFKKEYKIRIAHNGIEALEMIQKTIPDLIISDVLMPKMGGIELCKQLKQNPESAHIPIILLTALSSEKDKIEGLKYGAASFMSKPFSIDELKMKVSNLLISKRRLKEHFKDSGLINLKQLPANNKEEKFIKKIHQLIQENIENEGFGVEQLADKLQMNRSVLYMKIKNLTGLTTIDYMNSIRLEKAKDLLLNTSLTITEIAYQIGYRDANYFSRVFKKFNTISPTKYRKIEQEEMI